MIFAVSCAMRFREGIRLFKTRYSKVRQWEGRPADRRLITLCTTSDPNLSHVERGISRDFAARQSECDERILPATMAAMTFSLRRQKAPPPARLTQVS